MTVSGMVILRLGWFCNNGNSSQHHDDNNRISAKTDNWVFSSYTAVDSSLVSVARFLQSRLFIMVISRLGFSSVTHSDQLNSDAYITFET